jgi:hypothetical protein
MTTYNTGNPLGSTDARDLYDNAENLDHAVNSNLPAFTDRLGVSRRTFRGIEDSAAVVLAGLGYAVPVPYTAGISLTLPTQTVEYAGEVYAPAFGSLPFTTSGVFESANFRVIQGLTAADLASGIGASMVGYTPAGTGAVVTDVQAQLQEIVFAKNYTSIQAAFNAAAGKTLILERDAVYNITALTIPAGITLISRGAKFRKTAASSAYGITIAGAIEADAIIMSSVGGVGDNGIRITGGLCNIGHIEAKSDFSGSSYGVHFQSTASSTLYTLNIGRIVAEKYIAPVLVFNVAGSRIGTVECKEYRTGLYLRDVNNTSFARLDASVMLPGSTGGPGQNGLLLESTLANDSLRNVSFGRVEIADSAEHGVRLGGQLRMKDVHFDSIHTINTGAGGAGATGGSGFKALGATDGNPLLHENITIGTLLAEDCSTTGNGLGNFAGVQLENIKGFSCGSMIVQKKNNPFSSHYGISMAGVEGFDVGVWSLKDCRVHAVRIFDDAAFGKRYVRKVHVGGGLLEVTSSGSPVVMYEGGGSEYKDINVSSTIRGGVAAMRSEALTAGGSYESNNWRVVYSDPLDMTGAPALQLSTSEDQFVVDFTGPYYGSYAPDASNGSVYKDPTSQVNPLRIRKGANWVSLGADTQTVVIADDTVFTFVPNRSSGFLFVTLPSVTHYGQAWFRATSSPVGAKSAGGANFLVVSTALTGTTGTDGNVTLGVQNNLLYVENRSGGSQTVTVTQQA